MSGPRHADETGQEHGAGPNYNRRRSVNSVTSTAGASSYGTAQETEERNPQSPRPPNETRHRRMLSESSADSRRSGSQSSRGHGRTQSVVETRSTNTRRREKAAVGFACLNCKKAHLACDGTDT